jgi:hypothetical protein
LPAYPGKGRPYPYFKVQALDARSLAWRDHRREAFDNEASARVYQASLAPDIRSRIVRWDEGGATPLGEPA